MAGKELDTSRKKELFTNNKGPRPFLLIAIVAFITLGIISAFYIFSSGGDEAFDSPFGEPYAAERSYLGRVVSMTKVEPIIGSEQASIPMELLEANEIVYFEVTNEKGFAVPLMAYITPSGRIFTGSSMCEPCQGRYFSLAGETLVCDTCRTTYNIETHQFIAGSQDCGSYPPVFMKPTIENGMVGIALDDILQWQIRAY
jgi:hypothetical protein